MTPAITHWDELARACTLAEDDAVLALNKPAGISVVGERHGTDLLRLAKEAGRTIYPAHRVDKVTSGLVLFAKELRAHGGLTRQFAKRTVEKGYLALTESTGLPDQGTIDLPLMTASSGRIRIAAERGRIGCDDARGLWSVPGDAVLTRGRSYPSVTVFGRVAEAGGRTLLVLRPVTGRRHQIRVHLAWIGHALAGDPLFDKQAAGRTFLHSWRLALAATWRDGAGTEFVAPAGADFWSGFGAAGGGTEHADLAAGVYERLRPRYHQALAAAGGAEGDGGDL